MSKNPKRPRDPNQLAKMIVDIATGEADAQPKTVLSEARVKASVKGGKERATKLSEVRRAEIAKGAAKARWNKSA